MSLTLDHIKLKLLNNEMTYEEAANLIYGDKKKPWQTKAWKEKRDQLIKDSCEQCGTSESPMVLQHLWHPQSYQSLIRTIYLS